MKSLLLLLLFIAALYAHKLNIFYSIEDNDTVQINTYFASGSPCQQCQLIFKDVNDKILLSTFTDKNGDAIINSLPGNTASITVDGGMGHAATVAFEHIPSLNPPKQENPLTKWLLTLGGFIAIFASLYFLKKKR